MKLILIQLTEATGETTGGKVSPPPTGILVTVILLIGIFVLILAGFLLFPRLRRSAGPPGPGVGGQDNVPTEPLGYQILVVAVLIVATIFLGTMLLAFTVTPSVFGDPTQILAALTGVFGIITTLVGFYFGIKTSGDTRTTLENVHRQTISALTPIGTTFTVSAANPPPGTTSAAGTVNVISATFSEDVAPATINSNTFTLTRRTDGETEAVQGEVTYDPASKTATFATGPLRAGSYQATLTTGVRNQAGIALSRDYVWNFTITEP